MTQPRYAFIAMFLLILAAPFAIAQNGDPFGDDWIQEVPNPFNPFERQESAAPEVESPDLPSPDLFGCIVGDNS